MINSLYSFIHRNLPLGQSNTDPNQVLPGRVKNVIVARYLSNSYPLHHEGSNRDIKERLTSTVFDQNKLFQISEQPPTDDQIFSWFINSDFAPKLHRRAIEAGDLSVESFFRTSGVDVNRADEKTGNTPLMLAARSHQPVLVERLMRTGADALARNHDKESAIEQAIYQCEKTGYEKPHLLGTLKHLLSDTRVFDQLTQEMTEFIFTKTERAIAELFINHTKSSLRSTVDELINSKREEAPDLLRLILSKFPLLVNKRDRFHKTPLMTVAESGNHGALSALLDQPGIKVEAPWRPLTIPNLKTRWTAYSLAFENQNTDCMDLLENFGAQKKVIGLTAMQRSMFKLKIEWNFSVVKSIIFCCTGISMLQCLAAARVDAPYLVLCAALIVLLPAFIHIHYVKDIYILNQRIRSARHQLSQKQAESPAADQAKGGTPGPIATEGHNLGWT